MKTILIVGNILFIKIDNWKKGIIDNLEDRYVAANVDKGGLTMNQVYTYSEIKAAWPDIKEGDGLFDIEKVWRGYKHEDIDKQEEADAFEGEY
jgi:hypothetical protein